MFKNASKSANFLSFLILFSWMIKKSFRMFTIFLVVGLYLYALDKQMHKFITDAKILNFYSIYIAINYIASGYVKYIYFYILFISGRVHFK